MSDKMIFICYEPREVPGLGVFEPGQEVDYDETLYATGLFKIAEPSKKKGGDK